MDWLNSLLNLIVPPAGLIMLAFSWPTLFFLHACEWLFRTLYREDMDGKVVLITGASSAIGEQIVYEYARRRANLVLVARRENRLWGIRDNARLLGARQVLIMAADVVKLDDCRKFVGDAVSFFGHLDHLVNAASLGHTFFFEEATDASVFPHLMDINFWGNVYPSFVALPHLRRSHGRIVVNASVDSWLPLPRMSLYAAAKAALVNFYETLRYEVKDEIGITVATHGWVGSDMIGGRFLLEEGAEMQWKEEREASFAGGQVEEFARSIVAGACRGDANVRFPSWYDIFQLYRVFAPDVLSWTFRLLFAAQPTRKTSAIGVGTKREEPTTITHSSPPPLKIE
ncbi:hydroxysteroid dehydrogenase 5 [Wolffia australiana]